MPSLQNTRHEAFAQGLAKGLGNSEAYRKAGYDSAPGAAAVSANRLLKDANIRSRIDEIRAEADEMDREATAKACEALSIDKQWVMSRLVENANRAMQAVEIRNQDGGTGEYKYDGAVANRSLELLGKELGMFKDKTEIKHSGGMDIAWLPVS